MRTFYCTVYTLSKCKPEASSSELCVVVYPFLGTARERVADVVAGGLL